MDAMYDESSLDRLAAEVYTLPSMLLDQTEAVDDRRLLYGTVEPLRVGSRCRRWGLDRNDARHGEQNGYDYPRTTVADHGGTVHQR